MKRDISDSAWSLLRQWSGSAALSEAIREFPRLKIYLVGGTLRDLFLSLPHSQDFDFLIDGSDIERAFEFLRDNGNVTVGPFGSPRWHPRDRSASYCDFVPLNAFRNGCS